MLIASLFLKKEAMIAKTDINFVPTDVYQKIECCYPTTDNDCPVSEENIDIGTGNIPPEHRFLDSTSLIYTTN